MFIKLMVIFMIDSLKAGPGNVFPLAALCGFEAGAIALLHRLGAISWMQMPWGSLRSWLAVAPIEDVVAAGIRSVALVIAYWIAGSTAAYGAARISKVPRLIRATAWATLPPIRRTIDRAIATTIAAAVLASPATPTFAAEIPSPPDLIVYQIPDGAVPTPITPPAEDTTIILPPGVGGGGYTPHPAGGVMIEDASTSVEPAGTRKDVGVTDGTAFHEVAAGDNMWTIAASHLRAVFPDRTVDTGEVATYWRRVIEINTAGLRSGNPNLIYPGERILLPDAGPRGNT